MHIDLEKIKKKYPDIDWSIEDVQGHQCLIGKKGKKYKAFVIPPHNFFMWKQSGKFMKVTKTWPDGASAAINKILHES